MAKSTATRPRREAKTDRRNRTHPLTPHPAGYWCKSIRGKIHYFGRWGRRVNGKMERPCRTIQVFSTYSRAETNLTYVLKEARHGWNTKKYVQNHKLLSSLNRNL